jgi:hypothetical protein
MVPSLALQNQAMSNLSLGPILKKVKITEDGGSDVSHSKSQRGNIINSIMNIEGMIVNQRTLEIVNTSKN